MVPYILHVSVLLATFFLFYKVFLERETFYNLNRIFLVASLIISVSLPLVSVPESFSFHQYSHSVINDSEDIETPVNVDIESDTNGIKNDKSIESETLTSSGLLAKANQIDWIKWLKWTYLVGLIIFLINFLIQFALILIKRIKLESFKDGIYRIIELKDDEAPFSFLNWIFINPSAYDPETFDQILHHEKIHVAQAHFADKLMAEIMVIVFWFNPFSWFYRNSISNNLEYITDDSMLNLGTEKQLYQMNLLKISVPQHALDLTTNYNESFLTKRIKMMNSRKSSAKSSWKYILIFPVIALSLASLNGLQASTANENPQEITALNDNKLESSEGIKNPKNKSKDKDKDKDKITKEKVKIKSNKSPKSKAEKTKLKEKIQWDYDRITPGHWQGKIRENDVCFYINNSKGKHTWTMHECFSKSLFPNISSSEIQDFNVRREAGTLVLSGKFNGNDGEGIFEFKANESYKKALAKFGINNATDKDLFQIFLNNTGIDFVRKLKSDNLSPTIKDVVTLGIHGVDDQYDDFMKIYALTKEKPSTKRLTEMAIHNVQLDLAQSLHELKLSDFTVKRLIDAHIHGVSESLVASVKRYNFPEIQLKNIIDMTIHGVSGDYINKMIKLGYKSMTPKNFIDFAIHGVQVSFVHTSVEKNMNFSPQEFINMSIHGANAEFINGMEDAGFGNLSGKEIEAAKIHGVSPSFAKDVRSAGYSDITMKRLVDFRIHGVNMDLIQGMKDLGLDYSEKDLVDAAIHGVSVRYVKDIQSLGIEGLSPKSLVDAKIHGVSAKFIEKARSKGYNLKSIKEYVKIKIQGI